MKRLISLILALILIPCWATACDEPMLPKCDGAVILSGDSWWPITEDCRIAGIKDADEMLYRVGVQSTTSQFVAGRLVNGWARVAWAVRTVTVGCQMIGLTKLANVSITIWPEYADMARAVVESLLGEGTELSANAIVACSIWWDGEYASLIFHPSYSDRFQVGYVSFNNGEAVTPLMLGHFAGELHFGLRTSDELPPDVIQAQAAAQAEAEAQAQAQTTAQASATASATADAAVRVCNSGSIDNSGDGCWRNNSIIQVNLSVFGAIRNWLGIGVQKEGGCEE